MRNILVTGGAGFVGRHIIKRFLNMGDRVVCVDSLVNNTGAIDPLIWPLYNPIDYNNFIFEAMDCRDYFKLSKEYFDYTFHLAAVVGGRLMIENNPLAAADDLSIDAAYWQWAKEAKPGKTVCFSSSAAYPIVYQLEHFYELLKENMIKFKDRIGLPDMTYGWAKLTHEYLAKLAYEKYGLKSVVYRPFSGYGEDQDDTYPFPSICKRVLKSGGKKDIVVWGTGKQMRDFIYIEDCVDGILQTMDKIDNADAINLSTGIYTSFIDFANIAIDLCGYNVDVKGTSNKPEGVFARAGDTEKQKQLGFNYKIDFKTGIENALKYYEK